MLLLDIFLLCIGAGFLRIASEYEGLKSSLLFVVGGLTFVYGLIEFVFKIIDISGALK